MKRLMMFTVMLCLVFGLTACKPAFLKEPLAPGATAPTAEVPTQPTTQATTQTTTQTTPAPTTATAAPEEPYMEAYRALNRDYKVILEERLSGEWTGGDVTEAASDVLKNAITEEVEYQWSCMVIELPMFEKGESPDYYGYLLYDLNKDDIPELFWVRMDHSIAAVFTYYNNRPVLLNAYWARSSAYISEEGELYGRGSSGAASTHYSIYAVRDGKLEDVSGFYSDLSLDGTSMVFYEYDEGEETAITRERFDQVAEIYPGEHSEFWLSKTITPLY